MKIIKAIQRKIKMMRLKQTLLQRAKRRSYGVGHFLAFIRSVPFA